jgi:uncharacterized protein (DUF1015 family)
MAKVNPFNAVRAKSNDVNQVVTKSYDKYSENEIINIIKNNQKSFLQIIHPFFKKNTFKNLDEKFKAVKERYKNFKNQNILIEDKIPAYYLYQKETNKGSFIGIIAAVSTKDYKKQIIKKHEKTIKKREVLFKNYLKKTGFNAEPVLLTYPNNKKIDTIIDKYKEQTPEYHFTTQTGKTHTLWIINNTQDIKDIKNEFKKIDSLYIADGHHRSASSYLLSKELQTKKSNYFLSYLISESNLKISSFNRLVRTLNGLAEKDFLEKLSKKFEITLVKEAVYKPKQLHEFSMYIGSNTYKLKLKKDKYKFKTSLHQLDAHILYKNVLKKMLNIKNVRTNKDIEYVSEFKGQDYLKNKVLNNEFKVAFGLYPVTIEQLKKISDDGLTMPPKSTYIRPKLKSGLIIYEF